MQRAAIAWTILVALGCGRLGYIPLDEDGVRPGEVDTGDSGMAVDAAAGERGDSGSSESDGAVVMLDAASTPELDGGANGNGGAPQDAAGAADSGVPWTGECDSVYRDALVCSDFESDPSDGWTFTTRSGVVETQSTQVHRGARALRAATTVPGGLAFANRRFDTQDGALWGRLYLYVPGAAAISGLVYLGIDHDANPTLGLDFGLNPGGVYGLHSHESGGFTPASETRVPPDRWVCVQWHVQISDTGGAMELTIDGTREIHVEGVDTRPGGPLDCINVGLDWTRSTQTPLDVFVDDVVVAPFPVPCHSS